MLLVSVVFFLTACHSTRWIDSPDNSRNSLDWAGVYRGEIAEGPWPDIDMEITLYPDQTYKINCQYIDKPDLRFSITGNFKWHIFGNGIILDTKNFPDYYYVEENMLIQLMIKGSPLCNYTEQFVLRKQ